MDGIPALDLWDLVFEVFHFSPNQSTNTKDQVRRNSSRNTTSDKHTQNRTKVPTQHDNLDLSGVHHVSPNAKSSRLGAMLYIFEDNEAVVKMIIEGRSKSYDENTCPEPTESRWIGCLTGLIWTQKNSNQVCRHQTPTVLTKGNFTRHKWNNLLHSTSAISAYFAALRISA